MKKLIYNFFNIYIYLYIIYQSQNLTVASARNWRVCKQGRRRQGRGRHGRAGQGDRSKADRAKAEQGVGKKQGRACWALCNMNKQMCRAGPKRRARKKGPK